MGILSFEISSRRDYRLGASRFQTFMQLLAVLAFVGDQFGRGRHGSDAGLRDLEIMHVAGRQEQDERAAF